MNTAHIFLNAFATFASLVSLAACGLSYSFLRMNRNVLDEIRARRHPILPSDVNVVRGAILPAPDNPRWTLRRLHHPKTSPNGKRESYLAARIGSIDVTGFGRDALGIKVRGEAFAWGTEEATAYARAVTSSMVDREAQKAIEGAP